MRASSPPVAAKRRRWIVLLLGLHPQEQQSRRLRQAPDGGKATVSEQHCQIVCLVLCAGMGYSLLMI